LETRGTACYMYQHSVPEEKGGTHLVDVAQNNVLDGIVLQNFADDTSVTSANDQNLLWVRVAGQG
jgi:hypothetical protein